MFNTIRHAVFSRLTRSLTKAPKMPSVFHTGATGYIGGQVLHDVVRSHPEYTVATLVRSPDAAKQIAALYPNVRVVVGDLDNGDLIESEASKADVVLHLATNKHLGSFQAIQRGLSKRSTPTFWVQVSGASAIAIGELSDPSFVPGQPSDVIFDDLDGAGEIRSLVRAHPARVVDNYLLDVAKTNPTVHTAIVMPPIIYGVGEGVKTRSIQIPTLAKDALQRGKTVRLGKGQGRWGNIHIRDLGTLITSIAAAGGNGVTDKPLWGDDGIYLTGFNDITWAEISDRVAKAAADKGYIPTSEVDEITEAEADKVLAPSRVFLASNARSKARRAAEILGWKPVQFGLPEGIVETVDLEAKSLGKA